MTIEGDPHNPALSQYGYVKDMSVVWAMVGIAMIVVLALEIHHRFFKR